MALWPFAWKFGTWPELVGASVNEKREVVFRPDAAAEDLADDDRGPDDQDLGDPDDPDERCVGQSVDDIWEKEQVTEGEENDLPGTLEKFKLQLQKPSIRILALEIFYKWATESFVWDVHRESQKDLLKQWWERLTKISGEKLDRFIIIKAIWQRRS